MGKSLFSSGGFWDLSLSTNLALRIPSAAMHESSWFSDRVFTSAWQKPVKEMRIETMNTMVLKVMGMTRSFLCQCHRDK